MKKGLLLVIMLLGTMLVGCTEEEPKEEIIIYDVEDTTAFDMFMVFAEVGDYTILRTKVVKEDAELSNLTFDGCTYNDTIVDFYVVDGDEIRPLFTYFNTDTFTIDELISIGIPFTNCRTTTKELDEMDRYEPIVEYEVLFNIREFEVVIHRGLVCAMMVGPIVKDTYNFGMYGMGCDDDLDWIGYRLLYDGYLYKPQELVDTGYITTTELYALYFQESLSYSELSILEDWECHYDKCVTEVTYEDTVIEITYDIYSNMFKSYIIDDQDNKLVFMFNKYGWGYDYEMETNCNHYESSCPLGRTDDYDEFDRAFTLISDLTGLETYLSNYIKAIFEE